MFTAVTCEPRALSAGENQKGREQEQISTEFPFLPVSGNNFCTKRPQCSTHSQKGYSALYNLKTFLFYYYNLLLLSLLLLFVCVCVNTRTLVEVRGPLCGVGFLLLPLLGLQGVKMGHEAHRTSPFTCWAILHVCSCFTSTVTVWQKGTQQFSLTIPS